MKKSIINACILGLGLLSMTACSDPMDEITSLIVGRNFSPVNFETKDITKESASFQWTAVSGATSYELQIFADSDLDFSGEPTFVFKNISKDDIPYAVSGLMYDTQYSARVMAVDDNDATRNSKWSEVSFRTNAQQIFKSVSNSDIADRSVVMNWPAGEEVTTIYAVASETGDTITTKQLTETEIAAGKAIVDGLQPETKYDVYLYNGSKKRGTKTFKTIADLNGAIVVRPGDDFASLIKNAEAGSVFALMPDTFKIMSEDETGTSAVAISKSIEIKGIYPTAAPVIQGRFEINDGASVSIDNVVLDGSANVSTAYNTPPRAGKKFLNLGEGLDLLFKDSSADKEAVFKELFFTSEGRLNRKSYIYRSFFLSIVLFVVQGIWSFAADTFGALDLLFSIVAFVLGIFQLAANIMMGVRRLHDLDKCGWWMLLLIVPLVNLFFCLYLLFFKGTEGPNQYGDDPLQQ